MANVCVRVDHTFNTLRRECSNKRFMIVCHGEIMWAFRVRIERLSQIRYHHLKSSKDPSDIIHHAHILHYSRIHPNTGEIYPHFRFVILLCHEFYQHNLSLCLFQVYAKCVSLEACVNI